jgi:hypothetical protein
MSVLTWGGHFYWKQGLQDSRLFSSAVTCDSVVVIFWTNPSQCTTIYLFLSMLIFADGVFPGLVYADITFKTVALDTLSNVAVFITGAPAKWAPTTYSFFKSDKSLVLQFFHTDCHSTKTLQSANKPKNIQCF